jgi:hypothetical protein
MQLLKQQVQESSEYKAAFDVAKFNKILSQMYGDCMNKVRDGRADLWVLKDWENYVIYSSKAYEAKQTITFFKLQAPGKLRL